MDIVYWNWIFKKDVFSGARWAVCEYPFWVQNFWGERCWWRASAPAAKDDVTSWARLQKIRRLNVHDNKTERSDDVELNSCCRYVLSRGRTWQDFQRPARAKKIVLRARGSHASDFFSKRRKKCVQDLTSALVFGCTVESSINCHSPFETQNSVYGSKGRWSMTRRNHDP